MRRRTALAGLVGGMAIAGFTAMPTAAAIPQTCEEIPWGPFGNQSRLICDNPYNDDGSWVRQRTIGIPAGFRQGSSQCYGGAVIAGVSWGYSNCQITPAGYYPQVTMSNDIYLVYPDTVPAGEPGHLG